jgi:hypothetical protein
MDNYTFIASRDGEVYTAQFAGPDMQNACLAWGDHFAAIFTKKGFDPVDFRDDIAFKVAELPPVPVAQASNLWCFSFLVLGKAMWVHIVKTAPDAKKT